MLFSISFYLLLAARNVLLCTYYIANNQRGSKPSRLSLNSFSVKHLIQHLPPSRTLGTAHSTRNRTFLHHGSALQINALNCKGVTKLTCIPSVIAHHSLTLGFSLIRFISPSQSSPTYLNVAKIVRSLSKNMESMRLS